MLDSVPPGTECLCIHCLRSCDPSGTCPACSSLSLQCALCSPLPRVGLTNFPVTSPVGHAFADCVIRENSYVDFGRLQAECHSRLVMINFPAKVVCQLSEGWLCCDIDREDRDFLLYLFGFDFSWASQAASAWAAPVDALPETPAEAPPLRLHRRHLSSQESSSVPCACWRGSGL